MGQRSKTSRRALAAKAFAPEFRAVFDALGSSLNERAKLIGTAPGVLGDRYIGRSLPSQFERLLICAVLEDFSGFDDPEERVQKLREFLLAGIKRMNKRKNKGSPAPGEEASQ